MSFKPYKNSLTLVAVLIVIAIVVTSCRNIADRKNADPPVNEEAAAAISVCDGIQE